MVICTYDNPHTMQRECWQDGQLLCSYDAFSLNFLEDTVPPEYFFFGVNVGRWLPGQVVGDPEAKQIKGEFMDAGDIERYHELVKKHEELKQELEQVKCDVQCLKEEKEARERSDESMSSDETAEDRLKEEVHTYRKVLKKIAETNIEGDLECDGYAWIQRTAKMALGYYNRL